MSNKSLISFIAASLFFFGLACESLPAKSKSGESTIPLTKDFLTSGWLIDSIDGVDSFIQEWAYFTPQERFWRLSYYNETYIIDSSLEIRGNSIFDGSELKYSVDSVDSNHLILTEAGRIFHLKRGSGNFDRIASLVKSNPKKLLINLSLHALMVRDEHDIMAIELVEDALKNTAGTVVYPKEFEIV